MMKYGIVIPCYNESDRLPFKEFKAFLDSHPNHVCCFVNDGSIDDTLVSLLSFKLKMGHQVMVCDMPKNSGKAEAVRYGVNQLLINENLKLIGFLDADLATGFEDYCNLETTLENHSYSLVFGSRKEKSVEDIERSLFRKFTSGIIGWLIMLILRLPIKDTQCGAKVLSRQAAKAVFSLPFKTKWLFDVEIFLRLKSQFPNSIMNQLCEVPLSSWNDVDGSKLKPKDAVQIPLMLLKIALTHSTPSVKLDNLYPKQAA